MKAIRVKEFGGPAVMKLEEVPDPIAGPGDIVVRVRAAGVNPVDAYMHSGTYARKPLLPYTPGQDGAGEVVAVGADVTDFKAGDRVYVCGVGSGMAVGARLSAAVEASGEGLALDTADGLPKPSRPGR